MAFKDEAGKDARVKETWFLDNRCSNHMCGTKEWFFALDGNFRDTIKLRNGSKHEEIS